MRVDLCLPGELGPTEISAWRAMQRATPSLSNPFLSPEFAITVGRFKRSSRVAVVTDGQSTIGFFPFERHRLGAGAPILGWPGSLCQGLVHAPGAEWDSRELLRECRLSIWQFDHLIASQAPFKPYHEVVGSSSVMDLSDGFASYQTKLRKRSAHFFKDIARCGRNLAGHAEGFRFVADSRDTRLMRKLMEWKSGQYRRIGTVDRFDRPWIVGLLDALHATRSDDFSGLLCGSYLGDEPIAAIFALRCRDFAVGWFTAYDSSFGKYSPGLMNLMHMAEEVSTAGVRAIDLGKGPESFKLKLKSYDSFLAEGIVTVPSLSGAAHRACSVSTQWANHALLQRPRLYHATRRVRSALR